MTLRRRGYLNEAKTGHCYETALLYISHQGKSGDVVVHGRPSLQVPPYREYGHAWIERGEQVIDKESGYEGPRAFYYSMGKIDHKKNLVYTREQAREFALSHEHYGPWEGPMGTKMTSKQKKAWKELGRKPPRRTKKSTQPQWTMPKVAKDFLKSKIAQHAS